MIPVRTEWREYLTQPTKTTGISPVSEAIICISWATWLAKVSHSYSITNLIILNLYSCEVSSLKMGQAVFFSIGDFRKFHFKTKSHFCELCRLNILSNRFPNLCSHQFVGRMTEARLWFLTREIIISWEFCIPSIIMASAWTIFITLAKRPSQLSADKGALQSAFVLTLTGRHYRKLGDILIRRMYQFIFEKCQD